MIQCLSLHSVLWNYLNYNSTHSWIIIRLHEMLSDDTSTQQGRYSTDYFLYLLLFQPVMSFSGSRWSETTAGLSDNFPVIPKHEHARAHTHSSSEVLSSDLPLFTLLSFSWVQPELGHALNSEQLLFVHTPPRPLCVCVCACVCAHMCVCVCPHCQRVRRRKGWFEVRLRDFCHRLDTVEVNGLSFVMHEALESYV